MSQVSFSNNVSQSARSIRRCLSLAHYLSEGPQTIRSARPVSLGTEALLVSVRPSTVLKFAAGRAPIFPVKWAFFKRPEKFSFRARHDDLVLRIIVAHEYKGGKSYRQSHIPLPPLSASLVSPRRSTLRRILSQGDPWAGLSENSCSNTILTRQYTNVTTQTAEAGIIRKSIHRWIPGLIRSRFHCSGIRQISAMSRNPWTTYQAPKLVAHGNGDDAG